MAPPVYAFGDVVPVVHSTAYVHPTASLIGDVIVGPGCYVGPHASLRGDLGRFVMKEGANLQDGCIVHTFPGRLTELGGCDRFIWPRQDGYFRPHFMTRRAPVAVICGPTFNVGFITGWMRRKAGLDGVESGVVRADSKGRPG